MLLDQLEQFRILWPAFYIKNQQRPLCRMRNVLFKYWSMLRDKLVSIFDKYDALIAKHGDRF